MQRVCSSVALLLVGYCLHLAPAAPATSEYSESLPGGGQRWGFDSPQGYHRSEANANNAVRGSFGYTEPRSGQAFRTEYSAGRAGFIAQGDHITRRGDLSLNARLPPGTIIPRPDKAYSFNYRNPQASRREAADTRGDVRGRYSYLDDVGIRRTVDYVAGSGTGYVVTSAGPDPPVIGPAAEAQYYRPSRPGAPPGPAGTRGYLSSQLGGDGSYHFQHSSPEQRRSETSDAFGRVQGEYSFVDDRGQRHSVRYEAGPGIGFRILRKDSAPSTPVLRPSVFPVRPIYRPQPSPRPQRPYNGPNRQTSLEDEDLGGLQPLPSSPGPAVYELSGSSPSNNNDDVTSDEDNDTQAGSQGGFQQGPVTSPSPQQVGVRQDNKNRLTGSQNKNQGQNNWQKTPIINTSDDDGKWNPQDYDGKWDDDSGSKNSGGTGINDSSNQEAGNNRRTQQSQQDDNSNIDRVNIRDNNNGANGKWQPDSSDSDDAGNWRRNPPNADGKTSGFISSTDDDGQWTGDSGDNNDDDGQWRMDTTVNRGSGQSDEEGEDQKPSYQHNTFHRSPHFKDGGEPVTSVDLARLRPRLSPTVPRLAQVIGLDHDAPRVPDPGKLL